MIKLIKIELLKLYFNKLSRYFILIYFALHLLINYTFSKNIDLGFQINFPEMGLYSFPLIWNSLCYFDSFLKIFLAFILVNSLVNEFQNATFKQNIIDGLSRNQWLSSKYLSFILFCLISIIFIFVSTLILGTQYTKDNYDIFHQIEFLLFYFIENLLFISFAFLFALLFKNSIFTFLGLFIWNFIEWIIKTVTKVSNAINQNVNTHLNENAKPENSWDFFPLEAAGNLIKNPAQRTEMSKAFGMSSEYTFPTESLIVSIIYISIFIGLSYLYINKKDW